MNQKSLPRPAYLGLGLALLLAAWTACKPADPKAGSTPGAASSSTTATAAAPGQPSSTPASGSPTFNLSENVTPPPAPAATMTPDKMPDIVAKVNGETIKKDVLLKGAQVAQVQLGQMGRPVPLTPDFYRGVLDRLVGILLLQQEAKALHVVPSEQDVDQQLAASKKRFGSEEAYQKALKQLGLTEELLRQQTRDELATKKYLESQVVPQGPVPDQAIRDFYEKNKDQIRLPDRMHLRHILVAVKAQASAAEKEKARAKAEDLRKQLTNGADFAKLAAANSDDPGSKVRGGDLGWIASGQTPPTLEKAADALKANEISPVVESPFGYHVIQLLERQAATQVPYEQAKDRIAMIVRQKLAQDSMQAKIKELRAKAKVEVYL
ncbi:MAG: peptidylprolyl isomerase [Thermoanaerobaculia bacterium]